MKTWLRLLLITVTVGGGFAGLATTVAQFLGDANHWAAYAIFCALFAFIFGSGLAFVHNPRMTRPLFAAIAIQVPWFSSPYLMYRIYAGSGCSIAVVGGRLHWDLLYFGAGFRTGGIGDRPWGFGINLIAGLLLLSWWSPKTAKQEKPELPAATFRGTL